MLSSLLGFLGVPYDPDPIHKGLDFQKLQSGLSCFCDLAVFFWVMSVSKIAEDKNNEITSLL